MAQDERDSSPKIFHYEGGIPVFESRLSEVERKAAAAEARDEEYKKRQGRTNSLMARFTGLLVLTSIISGGINIWQARIANRSAAAAQSAAQTAAQTLDEIKKGSSDTHALAEAAGKQADAAGIQANRTKDIADRTLTQAQATKSLATAAETSSLTAAKELELAERPWVDADVRINGPLEWNVNGANLNVLLTLRNSGHSPAFNTDTYIKLVPIFGGPDQFQLRNEACKEAIRIVNAYGFGISLFPNVSFQQPTRVLLGNDDIKRGTSYGGKKHDAIAGIELIFCVGYKPTFKDSATYATGYIYDVQEFDRKTNLPGITFPVGERIEADHLQLKLGPGSIVAQ